MRSRESGASRRGHGRRAAALRIGGLVLALALAAASLVIVLRPEAVPDRWIERVPGLASPTTGTGQRGSGDGPDSLTALSSPHAMDPDDAMGDATASTTAGCTVHPGPIIPARMRIARLGVRSPVESLGTDAVGAAAAPPKGWSNTAAWYNHGPRPGASAGRAVLSVHSYHWGTALGDRLVDGLHGGELIRLIGRDGRTACYRYDHSVRISVAAYNADPASTVLYDDTGAPGLAIVTCAGYRWSTGRWTSRIILYARPV
jgi:hypothetical protein